MFKIQKIYPRDIIGIIAVIASFILMGLGINHVVSGIAIMILWQMPTPYGKLGFACWAPLGTFYRFDKAWIKERQLGWVYIGRFQ